MNYQILKSSGLKNTEARMAILSCLEKESRPMDASALLSFLKSEGVAVDQATVYRILNTFYEKGIIKRIEIGEGKYRYEVEKAHHHHLVCADCGRIEDIEIDLTEDFDREILKKKGFLVKSHSLEFFGLCKNCQF